MEKFLQNNALQQVRQPGQIDPPRVSSQFKQPSSISKRAIRDTGLHPSNSEGAYSVMKPYSSNLSTPGQLKRQRSNLRSYKPSSSAHRLGHSSKQCANRLSSPRDKQGSLELFQNSQSKQKKKSKPIITQIKEPQVMHISKSGSLGKLMAQKMNKCLLKPDEDTFLKSSDLNICLEPQTRLSTVEGINSQIETMASTKIENSILSGHRMVPPRNSVRAISRKQASLCGVELKPQNLFPQTSCNDNRNGVKQRDMLRSDLSSGQQVKSSLPFEISHIDDLFEEKLENPGKSSIVPAQRTEKRKQTRKDLCYTDKRQGDKGIFLTTQNTEVANGLSFADTSEFIKTGELRSAVYVSSDISPGIGPGRVSQQLTPLQDISPTVKASRLLQLHELQDRTPELQARVVDMSIENTKPRRYEVKRATISMTRRNTPTLTDNLFEKGGSFLSRATGDHLSKTGHKDKLNQNHNTAKRENKTPRTESCIFTNAGVCSTKDMAKSVSKKSVGKKQAKIQSSRNLKNSKRLVGSRSSEFQRSDSSGADKTNFAKSTELSKHIKSLSTACYSSVTKKKPVISSKQPLARKPKIQASKSSRSLTSKNVYSPAYHMKLSMIQVQQKQEMLAHRETCERDLKKAKGSSLHNKTQSTSKCQSTQKSQSKQKQLMSPRFLMTSPNQTRRDSKKNCQLDLISSVKQAKVDKNQLNGESEKSNESAKSSDRSHRVQKQSLLQIGSEKKGSSQAKKIVKTIKIESDQLIDTQQSLDRTVTYEQAFLEQDVAEASGAVAVQSKTHQIDGIKLQQNAGDDTFDCQSQETSGMLSKQNTYRNGSQETEKIDSERPVDNLQRQNDQSSVPVTDSVHSSSLNQKQRSFYQKFLTSPTNQFEDQGIVITPKTNRGDEPIDKNPETNHPQEQDHQNQTDIQGIDTADPEGAQEQVQQKMQKQDDSQSNKSSASPRDDDKSTCNPAIEHLKVKPVSSQLKVDVNKLLRPLPDLRVTDEDGSSAEKLSISDNAKIFDISQDNLLDQNLLMTDSNQINEEDDLLNSNIDDDLLNSENQAVNLLDDPIDDEDFEAKFKQITEQRKVTPTPACNEDMEIEAFKTPEMQRAVSDSGPDVYLKPKPTTKDNLHQSLTTIKEDCHEWQSDAFSLKSFTDSGHQMYQMLSCQSKQSAHSKPPFPLVKPLQVSQSANNYKQNQLILVNRLSSEDSSIQTESEAQSKVISILDESIQRNSTESNKIASKKGPQNCTPFPFAVQIISDGLDEQLDGPRSQREHFRSSDLYSDQAEGQRQTTQSHGEPEVHEEGSPICTNQPRATPVTQKT